MKFISIIVFSTISILIVAGARASLNSIKIIVNSKNQTSEVSRKFLAEAFLKKTTFWDDGDSILPVDLQSESNTRKEFSNKIINKPVTAVRSYW